MACMKVVNNCQMKEKIFASIKLFAYDMKILILAHLSLQGNNQPCVSVQRQSLPYFFKPACPKAKFRKIYYLFKQILSQYSLV